MEAYDFGLLGFPDADSNKASWSWAAELLCGALSFEFPSPRTLEPLGSTRTRRPEYKPTRSSATTRDVDWVAATKEVKSGCHNQEAQFFDK